MGLSDFFKKNSNISYIFVKVRWSNKNALLYVRFAIHPFFLTHPGEQIVNVFLKKDQGF